MNLRTVVIVTKPRKAEVADVAARLVEWFKSRGIEASTDPDAVPRSSGVGQQCFGWSQISSYLDRVANLM